MSKSDFSIVLRIPRDTVLYRFREKNQHTEDEWTVYPNSTLNTRSQGQLKSISRLSSRIAIVARVYHEH